MWAKPWGKRLHWGDAHWALLYHLLRIYVTGAWLTCKLLHSYRPQTAALRCYEKTQIYVKRLTCMANFNPSIITETGIKYGISPQHLCRWRLGSQELWVWTHNFAGSKKNKRLLILKFGIWEMCLYFQREGLKIAHLPQISLGWLWLFSKGVANSRYLQIKSICHGYKCSPAAGSSLQLEISSSNDIRTRWKLTSRGGRSSGGSWKYTTTKCLNRVKHSCDTVDLLRTREQNQTGAFLPRLWWKIKSLGVFECWLDKRSMFRTSLWALRNYYWKFYWLYC